MSGAADRVPAGLPGTPAAHRRRIRALDAFIDLVLEGNLPPTPKQVADRADISVATFFRYFENLNALRHDAASRMLERFPLLEVEAIGEGPLLARIERFVALRVALWEKVHLLARLQRTVMLQDPDAAQMVDYVRGVMANQVRVHFAPELTEFTPAQQDDTVAVIASLTSVESWEQFRHASRRSPLQIRRAWSDAIGAVLRRGND
ncbi:MAG: TetR/AcrR family transcriptional regulator [Myxococcota bacterium]|nr:TetR/AcrR family transcriptional regulator [Myxococcota bacterium]